MAIKMNLYLAGFMGTGKSTIGKELAKLLGRQFIDMDSLLEKKLGMTVKEVFEKKGEAFFRQEEKQLAIELSATANKIVACGGGTILDPDVYRAFSKSGLVMCLFTDKDQLIQRLERTSKRPLLQGAPVEEKVDELLKERTKIYEKITIRVNTTDLTPKDAAKKIIDLLKTRQRILDKLQSQYIVIS